MKAPVLPWLFEVVGPLTWLVLAALYLWLWRRDGKPSLAAIIFVAATTMWWQEWYGDWGAYVFYNPYFKTIPWGETTWTYPNKPWAVIPAYGWFYGLVYFPVIGLARKLQAVWPKLAFWMAVVLVASPLFYLWDLLIEGGAAVLGLWTYMGHVGPALISDRGTFPLVYPIIPFALMMMVTAIFIGSRRPDGTSKIEAACGVSNPDGSRQMTRLALWIVVMNACYLFFFIGPIVLVRVFLLSRNVSTP